jgi:peptidoglycan hydrolase CwlO-like protein
MFKKILIVVVILILGWILLQFPFAKDALSGLRGDVTQKVDNVQKEADRVKETYDNVKQTVNEVNQTIQETKETVGKVAQFAADMKEQIEGAAANIQKAMDSFKGMFGSTPEAAPADASAKQTQPVTTPEPVEVQPVE